VGKSNSISDQQFSEYSGEHLLHELNMLWETASRVQQEKQRSFMSSVLLESFAGHLRTLIEFFHFAPKTDYVRAKDFFAVPGDWNPRMTSRLKTALKRANGEASHLTWGRTSGTPPEKEWDVVGLLADIEEVAKEFAAKALASRLNAEVRKFLSLPSEEKRAWLLGNVVYSNVASQSLTFSPSASTATTATISKFTLPQFVADVEPGQQQ
jgi:hypothetical protein